MNSSQVNWDFWATKAESDFDLPRNLFTETDTKDPSERYREIEAFQQHPEKQLNDAAIHGKLEWTQYWLNKEFSLKDLNQALNYAANNGNLDVVKLLIDHGATSIDRAFIEAAQYDNLDVVKYLMPRGITYDAIRSALYSAAMNQHDDVVEYLESLKWSWEENNWVTFSK